MEEGEGQHSVVAWASTSSTDGLHFPPVTDANILRDGPPGPHLVAQGGHLARHLISLHTGTRAQELWRAFPGCRLARLGFVLRLVGGDRMLEPRDLAARAPPFSPTAGTTERLEDQP